MTLNVTADQNFDHYGGSDEARKPWSYNAMETDQSACAAIGIRHGGCRVLERF
jgi:hypothetical protein